MSDLYPSARTLAATTGIGWLTNNIKVVLVDSGYVYSTAHDFLDDVGAATRVATSGNLAGKTVVAGVCDANDVVFSALSGDTVTGIIVYIDTGVEATSSLLAYFDRYSTGGMISYGPSGVDATLRWYDGTTKIFKV